MDRAITDETRRTEKMLLIDEFLNKGHKNLKAPISLFNKIKQARYDSQRFLFSDEASRIVGDFAIECGDIILDNRQFALPPYEISYVEVNAHEYYKTAKQKGTVFSHSERKDHRIAYLNIGNEIYTFMAGADYQGAKEDIGMSYWKYVIGNPGDVVPSNIDFDAEDFARQISEIIEKFGYEDSDMQSVFRHCLYLGSSTPMKKMNKKLSIGDEIGIRWILPEDHALRQKPMDASVMMHFFGDVRNYWAMMLWLNQPTRTRFIGVPSGRRLLKGKLTPYMKYNTVEINLGRCKTVRKAFKLVGDRQSPSAHSVRSHWAHRGGFRACVSDEGHEWPLVSDEDGHFVCKKCGLQRWRVKEHVRGDAGKGWVNKEYEVAA